MERLPGADRRCDRFGSRNRLGNGNIVEGLADAAERVGVDVFHAGTSVSDDGEVVSAGGRVLSVTAQGSTLVEAREHAYAAVDLIRLEGSHHRRDIAARAADGRIAL